MENKRRIIVQPVLMLIRIYQRISRIAWKQNCRFYPTCSQYSYQSLEKHGLIKGIYFSIKRILKCHPYHSGGIDLVEKSS